MRYLVVVLQWGVMYCNGGILYGNEVFVLQWDLLYPIFVFAIQTYDKLRNTVLYLKSWRCQLWIWRSQMPFYWRREAEPLKRIFATIKSTIDTSNSSNTACGQKWFRFRHLPYIFHIKPFIFITFSWSHSLSDFHEIFSIKCRNKYSFFFV